MRFRIFSRLFSKKRFLAVTVTLSAIMSSFVHLDSPLHRRLLAEEIPHQVMQFAEGETMQGLDLFSVAQGDFRKFVNETRAVLEKGHNHLLPDVISVSGGVPTDVSRAAFFMAQELNIPLVRVRLYGTDMNELPECVHGDEKTAKSLASRRYVLLLLQDVDLLGKDSCDHIRLFYDLLTKEYPNTHFFLLTASSKSDRGCAPLSGFRRDRANTVVIRLSPLNALTKKECLRNCLHEIWSPHLESHHLTLANKTLNRMHLPSSLLPNSYEKMRKLAKRVVRSVVCNPSKDIASLLLFHSLESSIGGVHQEEERSEDTLWPEQRRHDLWKTSIHEASHAIIAHLLGYKVEYISNIARFLSRGVMVWGNSATEIPFTGHSGRIEKDRIAISIAGVCGEEVFLDNPEFYSYWHGNYTGDVATVDQCSSWILLAGLGSGVMFPFNKNLREGDFGQYQRELVDEQVKQVKKTLIKYTDWVLDLSRALMERRELGAKDFLSIAMANIGHIPEEREHILRLTQEINHNGDWDERLED